jgi:hypothetical protein
MIFVVKEISMENEKKAFKDIFYRKNAFIEKELKNQSEALMRGNIFCDKKSLTENESKTKSESLEIIERRRCREVKENFNRELFNNAYRVTSVAKPLIISLVAAFVLDLFYWVIAFTPYVGYMWIIGNICTFIQICSIICLIILFFYSFLTGRRITLNYDRLCKTFDKNLLAELDYL